MFVNRGDVSYRTAPLVVWDPTYLHLALSIYVPSAAAIDTSLAGDTNIKLLEPYGVADAGVEIIRYRKTVYVPITLCGFIVVYGSFPGGSAEPPLRSNF